MKAKNPREWNKFRHGHGIVNYLYRQNRACPGRIRKVAKLRIAAGRDVGSLVAGGGGPDFDAGNLPLKGNRQRSTPSIHKFTPLNSACMTMGTSSEPLCT